MLLKASAVRDGLLERRAAHACCGGESECRETAWEGGCFVCRVCVCCV